MEPIVSERHFESTTGIVQGSSEWLVQDGLLLTKPFIPTTSL